MSARVLLVEDHRLLRQGLRLLLEREPDMVVVGEAADGQTAIELARSVPAEVVLLDIGLPGLNGVDATRRLLEVAPALKVIVLTGHCSRALVHQSLKQGATGYVLKGDAIEGLVSAVRTVTEGRVYLCPQAASLVVEGYVSEHLDKLSKGVYERLTGREREVLQLMAEGKATKEVARVLSVSIKTAETHRRAIMEKLDIHSVAELTKYAIREGLTGLD